MLKAAETFFEWAVKRAAVMIAHAACDQHDRDVRRNGHQSLEPAPAKTAPRTTRH
jgi:hypothetical protein